MTTFQGPHQVCRADLIAVRALAAELADAFTGYVWTDWAFPADRRRERLRAAFEVYLGVAVSGLGEVWTTDDGHSVASWFAPGPPALSDIQQAALEETSRRLLGDNADRVEEADRAIAALRSQQPYLYRTPSSRVRVWCFWVCSSVLLTLDLGRFFARAGMSRGRAAIAQRRPGGAPLTGLTGRR